MQGGKLLLKGANHLCQRVGVELHQCLADSPPAVMGWLKGRGKVAA